MACRFKLDENLPRDAGVLLNGLGHDAQSALDEHLGGEPDAKVIGISRKENRILVTLDLDFAHLGAYPPTDYPGIWVLRPRSQSIGSILSLLRVAVSSLEVETVAQRLWIIEPGRIRIHE